MKTRAWADRALVLAIVVAMLLIAVSLASIAASAPDLSPRAYLPYVSKPVEPLKEVRGLWVTRFDWTNYGQPAQQWRIDEIVANASRAGFNVILFQVRGVADAYYQPGPEPWAQRVSGSTLGTPPNPYWDPLAYFIEKAHQKGIQLHAYINVYPVWDRCGESPPHTEPEHFYWKLVTKHGTTNYKLNGLQWDDEYNVSCSIYQRTTPASIFADEHYLEVARYLADNYAIDGLHLDNIRYGGRYSSCDPVSAARSGTTCFTTPPIDYASYADWQRAQVSGTVEKFYDLISKEHPEMMLSAAVWPTYINYWGWKTYDGHFYGQGYTDYYQDSQAWIKDGYIDALMPMAYSPTDGDPDPNTQNFRLTRWKTLMNNYQQNSGGRFIIAGIGSEHYYTYNSFAGIEDRINAARQLGTMGHAIFSYGGLDDPDNDGNPDNDPDYFQMLANGPYAEPAVLPEMSWR